MKVKQKPKLRNMTAYLRNRGIVALGWEQTAIELEKIVGGNFILEYGSGHGGAIRRAKRCFRILMGRMRNPFTNERYTQVGKLAHFRKSNGNQQPYQPKVPKVKNSKSAAHIFYESYDWRRLRYATLKRYGLQCMCCKRTDIVVNVDHIKPLRKYWELRLDPENVQVLCNECNHGKGNWDETDWRPEEKNQ